MTVLSQGKHLLRGSRLTDFDIRLGDSMCDPVSLTDSQIECRPPTNSPNDNVNDTSCQDYAIPMNVRMHVYALYYRNFLLYYMEYIHGL